MRNRGSQFSAISRVFPQILVDFQSVSIDFLSFSISFSQLQSILINFNQFQSVWLGQKRRNLLTTGRWGKQHVTFPQIKSVIISARTVLWTCRSFGPCGTFGPSQTFCFFYLKALASENASMHSCLCWNPSQAVFEESSKTHTPPKMPSLTSCAPSCGLSFAQNYCGKGFTVQNKC